MSTPDILKRILEKRLKRLEAEKEAAPLEELARKAESMPAPRSFREALTKPELSIIGEIKKASPSKGIIRADFDPVRLAAQYDGNVDALSVLTEQDFFGGHPGYLQAVHEKSDLPILRKDFIIDRYQVYEARVLGASCILLIVALLDDIRLRELLGTAEALSMDALVEVHDEEKMTRAAACGAGIIGINNRNLRTFEVDLDTTARLAQSAPAGCILVSESGIQSGEDVKRLGRRIDGILAGEVFMRAASIAEKAKELKDAYGT
jgi:indole-3-glycerol phosphate synthase